MTDPLEIDYVNWRGERSLRSVQPQMLVFDSNKWHPKPQWLLQAYDIVKGEVRTFALSGIKGFGPLNGKVMVDVDLLRRAEFELTHSVRTGDVDDQIVPDLRKILEEQRA